MKRVAGDIVETDPVKEHDRTRVTVTFSADTQFNIYFHFPSLLQGHPNEIAYSLLIEADERIDGQDLMSQVTRHEFSDVVERKSESPLGKVVGP